MFFVVHLVDVKKHRIFPKEWVRDSEIFLEKFVNYSINRNQTHLCFWSSKKNLFDEPDGDYEPDFGAPLAVNFPDNNAECCFKGKLVKYFRSYGDASDYMKKQRSISPPPYNQARIHEKPLPRPIQNELSEPTQNEDSFDGAEPSDNSSINNDGVSTTNSDNTLSNLEPVIDEQIGIKQEPELFIVDDDDLAQINAIFDTQSEKEFDTNDDDPLDGDISQLEIQNTDETAAHDESDEEQIEFVLETDKSFPMPSTCDAEGMVKRENDIISGNLSFNKKKNGDRVYNIGSKKVMLKSDTLKRFRKWLRSPFDKIVQIDKKVVELILISCVGTRKLAAHDVDDDSKKIAHSILETRVGQCTDRLFMFEKFIAEICGKYNEQYAE